MKHWSSFVWDVLGIGEKLRSAAFRRGVDIHIILALSHFFLQLAQKIKNGTAGYCGTAYTVPRQGNQKNAEHVPSPASLRSLSDTDDEVPIIQTIIQKTKPNGIWVPTEKTNALLADLEKNVSEDFEGMQAIPEGRAAVGIGIARDFGKDVGVFKGEVMHVKEHRKRFIYHVKYEDGDSEDFDTPEYQFAYEVRQTVDAGKFRRDETVDVNDDTLSNDGTEEEWHAKENVSDSDEDNRTSRKRSRQKQKNGKIDGKAPAKRQGRSKQATCLRTSELKKRKN